MGEKKKNEQIKNKKKTISIRMRLPPSQKKLLTTTFFFTSTNGGWEKHLTAH